MILLDTNVVSEPMRPAPDKQVMNWFSKQDAGSLFISLISEAELRAGVAVLPAGKRRDSLRDAIEAMLAEDFAGRVIPFAGGAIARSYAEIIAARRAIGRAITTADAMIAAIALAGEMPIATRNTRDFEGLDVRLINPWGVSEGS